MHPGQAAYTHCELCETFLLKELDGSVVSSKINLPSLFKLLLDLLGAVDLRLSICADLRKMFTSRCSERNERLGQVYPVVIHQSALAAT